MSHFLDRLKFLGRSIATTGSPNAALWAFFGLYAVGLLLNWWYYWRNGAEKPC